MARVRGKDTTPEMRVRRALWRAGLRYRLHDVSLPGRPDVVFPRHRLALFVHGCFWHRHHGCKRASMPSSNIGYWTAKFDRNVRRDAAVQAELARLGWRVLVVWECETKTNDQLDVVVATVMALMARGGATASTTPS